MKSFPILNAFKNPANIFIGIGFSVLFFDLSYYVMTNFVKADFKTLQCMDPSTPTMQELIFPIILSLLIGIYAVGIKESWCLKRHTPSTDAKTFSLLGIGSIMANLTLFCPICTLGMTSIMGITIKMEFFSLYGPYMRVVSLGILVLGILLLNHQLKTKTCHICKILK